MEKQKTHPRYAVAKDYMKTAIEIEKAKNHLDKIYAIYRSAVLKRYAGDGTETFKRLDSMRTRLNKLNAEYNKIEATL